MASQSQYFDASAFEDVWEDEGLEKAETHSERLKTAVTELAATLGNYDDPGEVVPAIKNIASSLDDWNNRASQYARFYEELDTSNVEFPQGDIDLIRGNIEQHRKEIQSIGMHFLILMSFV